MSRSKLKSYAPEARKDFIQAVTDRAAYYGLKKTRTEPVTEQGDTVVIQGRALPKIVAAQRKKLEERISRESFDQVMEAVAYTWFNRFVAIRFMELHGYLDHGYRVLSHPEGEATPEILEHAQHLDLPGLNKEKVVELKLDGTRDEELYRLLLVAQCNALNKAMPFLFERVQDESELLLPDNLLHSNSLIRKLVSEVEDEEWQEVEIIGWIYQFYISEKKDEVIGKVVKSEDIPAATQLFTPNWIVKYLVQNSIGRQWMATYPNSPLKDQMEYYIEPAEQTDEVNAKLAEITPESLNPEEMTLLDPACGSGHILAEGYDLFKAIYQERGYRAKDIPRLILEKNLHGLEIDDRAAQLASFAVLMKARADDRSVLVDGVKLSILSIQSSDGLDAERLLQGVRFADYGVHPDDLMELMQLFENAKTLGSLIQVPEELAAKLPVLKQLSGATSQDLFVSDQLKRTEQLVQQARTLAGRFDAVVANPPYMGSGAMNGLLKQFAKDSFAEGKADLFACFIQRGCTLAKETGNIAMITMHSWMFLSSFERLRVRIMREKSIRTMAHLGTRAFGSISGEVVQTTAFILNNGPLKAYKPAFFRLLDGGEDEKREALSNGENRFDTTAQDELMKIPGNPVAYWVCDSIRGLFSSLPSLGDLGEPRRGLQPGNTPANVRRWQEVSVQNAAFTVDAEDIRVVTATKRWVSFTSGGGFRKWWGNLFYVVNWYHDGHDIKNGHNPIVPNEYLYFRKAITWSKVATSAPAFRQHPHGAIPGDASPFVIVDQSNFAGVFASLNASPTLALLQVLAPTLNFQVGDLASVPILQHPQCGSNVSSLVELSRQDWNAYERSWEFQSLPLLAASTESAPTLEAK